MGELVKADQLSEKQRAFVDAVLAGASNKDAATLAGYSEETNPATVLGSRAVQNAIAEGCNAKLRGELRAKALRTLEELLSFPTPAATRFNAAKLILEQSEAPDGADKPLSAMTEDELMAVIAKAEQVKSAGLIDVTPSNGASS